jgi:hypothetical protein
MCNYGTIKIHFRSAMRAISADIHGTATAGELYKSGKVKTWIAHVAKATPTETVSEAIARMGNKS